MVVPTTFEARRGPAAFTLVELLVVIVIIVLVSVVTLPTVIPAVQHRQVSEGARVLQAALAGARDAAIRANAPRGIRLLPDPVFNGLGGAPLAANRWVPIEPAPEYSEGRITIGPYTQEQYNANPALQGDPRIGVHEEKFLLYNEVGPLLPNPEYAPTGWYWNIRQGDKIRLGNSGRTYTIVGPMLIGPSGHSAYPGVVNLERYINNGPPGPTVVGRSESPSPADPSFERLFLVNNEDDDGDGYVDESFDGIDNDGDGIVDPGFNGFDDNGNGEVDDLAELYISGTTPGGVYNPAIPGSGEFEQERLVGSQFSGSGFVNQPYTIIRQPVVSPGAREVTLPAGVVIDLTSWDAPSSLVPANQVIRPLPERSRLPVDPYTRTVDIMIAPNGQVVGAGGGGQGDFNPASPTKNLPFYHFWLAEREDVVPPLFGYDEQNITAGATPRRIFRPTPNPNYATGARYVLPMPADTPGYDPPNGIVLRGERRLITLFTRSGQIVTSDLSRGPTGTAPGTFNINNVSSPYYDAQIGAREVP